MKRKYTVQILLSIFLITLSCLTSNAQGLKTDSEQSAKLIKGFLSKIDIPVEKATILQQQLVKNHSYFSAKIREPNLSLDQLEIELRLNQIRINDILSILSPEERERYDEHVRAEKKANADREVPLKRGSIDKQKKPAKP